VNFINVGIIYFMKQTCRSFSPTPNNNNNNNNNGHLNFKGKPSCTRKHMLAWFPTNHKEVVVKNLFNHMRRMHGTSNSREDFFFHILELL
jgi:hypothetical protein